MGTKINSNVSQIYALIADEDHQEIGSLYIQLKQTLQSLKKEGITMILGHFNAKVGQGNVANIVGEYGLGTRNERGNKLVQFCLKEKFTITNKWFKLPPKRLYT